jgi:hypothetical protein
MTRPFPVIDADGHVIERDRELREFSSRPDGQRVRKATLRALSLGRLGALRPVIPSARTSRSGALDRFSR